MPHYATTLEPSQIVTNDAEGKMSIDNKAFNWEKQWYPIAVDEFTDKTRPQKLWLLGNEIVLWHDRTTWRVFEDSCPHRGVPLSEGRIEDNGELLCAYHAWRFDGEGKCTSIPQTKSQEKEEALKSNLKSCVHSYPTMVSQGLIWVWGEKGLPGSDVALEAAMKKPNLIEELHDESLGNRVMLLNWNSRDLPYGWDMFMENTLDPAHVPVSHHNVVGNRYKDAVPLKMSRMNSTTEIPVAEGGTYSEAYPADKGFAIRIESGTVLDNDPMTYSINDFRPPCLNKISAINKDGSKTILALYCTPTKPGYSRHIGAQVLVKAENNKVPKGLGMYSLPLPQWLLHVAASFFLHQDQVFLHQQERMLYHTSKYAFGRFDGENVPANNEFAEMRNDPKSYSKKYFTPNEHDMGISNLRKWIFEKASGGPQWGSAAVLLGLPKKLDGDELFDVYHSHTKSCTICQAAEKKMKIIRNLAVVGAGSMLMGLTALLSRPVARLSSKLLVGGLGAAFGAVALLLNKMLPMFHKFEFNHQDNK